MAAAVKSTKGELTVSGGKGSAYVHLFVTSKRNELTPTNARLLAKRLIDAADRVMREA